MDDPQVVEAWNTRLVGYCDLDGRPGIKLAMHEAPDRRRYLYVGSIFEPGWSIVDVTDAEHPKLVNYLDGPPGTWTLQVQVADGLLMGGLEQPPAGWLPPGGPPAEKGVMLWDLRDDPLHPRFLSHYAVDGTGTHRNFYAGGDVAVLSATARGYQHRIALFVDVSDPVHPREISRWWWPGQNIAAGEKPDFSVYLHGPAYLQGDRAYLGYGRVGMVVLDVSDIRAPKLVNRVSFGDLGSPRPGCHSAVPLPGHGLVVVNSEAHQDNAGDVDPLNYTFVVRESGDDYTVISAFPMPRPSLGLGYRSYYEKGGRFGPHNQHQQQGQSILAPNDNIVYMTYFNAGLRIFDVSDPFMPEEVGYFVPDDPSVRRGPRPAQLVTQFEDVLVDDRGFIFCTDKNRGVFVIRHDTSAPMVGTRRP
jgi:hypothetical protein